MNTNYTFVPPLALALAAGPMTASAIAERGFEVLGKRYRWLEKLAVRLEVEFVGRVRPQHRQVVAFLRKDYRFLLAAVKCKLTAETIQTIAPKMAPAAVAANWQVPALTTGAELARWLGVEFDELQWLADVRQVEPRTDREALRHYRYRVLSKPDGRVRVIEAPKEQLKALQVRLLRGLLEVVPTHDAVHGFRRGRSTRSFVEPHTGKPMVVRIDLEDFFPSILACRADALFRLIGYPDEVAWLITNVCTNTVPAHVLPPIDPSNSTARVQRQFYEAPHVPQGAPTSPQLANLIAYRLDCRLAGLARSVGATYTRYADDLAFSGGDDFARRAKRFVTHVAATVAEEGWRVNHHKTRLMPRGGRQQLAGIVVNEHANLRRDQFDRLKAVLHNCRTRGPSSQNRDDIADWRGHLRGRLAYVELLCPERGAKLRAIWDRIDWSE